VGDRPKPLKESLKRGNALDNIIFIIITVFVIAFVFWLSVPGEIDQDQQRND
jgi:hypothetical protein